MRNRGLCIKKLCFLYVYVLKKVLKLTLKKRFIFLPFVKLTLNHQARKRVHNINRHVILRF
jgi:hypothetical protein